MQSPNYLAVHQNDRQSVNLYNIIIQLKYILCFVSCRLFANSLFFFNDSAET